MEVMLSEESPIELPSPHRSATDTEDSLAGGHALRGATFLVVGVVPLGVLEDAEDSVPLKRLVADDDLWSGIPPGGIHFFLG